MLIVHSAELMVAATTVRWWSGWHWHGSFTTLDLIAASTNALNGALLARRPDHYKNFTIVGVLLMALLMGLGGGITRDVLVNQIPSALTNPAYLLLCTAAGLIGYKLAFAGGQLFREGLFQFMTSFSLPLRRASPSVFRSSASSSWPWSVQRPVAGTSTCRAASLRSTSSVVSGSSGSRSSPA